MKCRYILRNFVFSLVVLCVAVELYATDWVVSTTGGGDFTNISDAVTTASSGDTIFLTAGQTFTGASNRGISIAINLTFKSTSTSQVDPIIDLQGVNKFCLISGCEVHLYNLDIRNGYAVAGGAIQVNASSVAYIEACIFMGNKATGTNDGEGGGAILSNGTLIAYDSTFSGNNAAYCGAAIATWSGTATVSHCSFLENVSPYAAAVLASGKFIFIDSYFAENNASADGGAVYCNYGTFTFDTCNFSRNRSGNYGGAINNDHSSTYISSCMFRQNYAARRGGAVSSYYGSISVAGCTFSCNRADVRGGAIRNNVGTITVTCSRLMGNSAPVGAGPEIYNESGTVTAKNNWWGTNNAPSPTLFAGTVAYTPYLQVELLPEALWARISCPTLLMADFTQNSTGQTRPCTDFFSGAVTFSTTSGTFTPRISMIIDGQATTTLTCLPYSTDIFSVCAYVDTDITTTPYTLCMTVTPFLGAAAYVSPSGDDNNQGMPTSPVKTISKGIELATSCGVTGTVYLLAGSTLTGTGNKNISVATSVNFNRYGQGADPVIDLEGSGKLLSVEAGADVSLYNLDIRNGHAVAGGAIQVNSGSVAYIEACAFMGNKATGTHDGEGGGAILSNGTLIVYDSTFSGNNAAYCGAAIATWSGTATVSHCSFLENVSPYAAAILASGKFIFIDSYFAENNASVDGGAVYCNYGTFTFDTCAFSRNSSGNCGGAIDNDHSSVYFTSCMFRQNYAARRGGAVSSHYGSMDALGCNFICNRADICGGAIRNNGKTTTVSCSRFTGNTAPQGDAINNESGTVKAATNWWGTNADPSTISNLLVGSIDADPWITVSLSLVPPFVAPGGMTTLQATFSSDCMPDDVPVLLGTTDGTITPTLAYTLHGVASGLLTLSYAKLPFETMALVGPGAEAFSLSLTVTPYIVVLDLKKTATYTTLLPGYHIEYSYTVSNAGNVPLSNVVITDNKLTGTICMLGTLAPAEFAICTTSYAIQQADVDAGFVTNTATAVGDAPAGDIALAHDSMAIHITREPGISVAKFINDAIESTFWPGVTVPVGSPMDIKYVVTNTGNVTLTQIHVVDDQGYVVTQPQTTLLPSEVMTCTASTGAPDPSVAHRNTGVVTGLSADSAQVNSRATAYATSIPVGKYRFNWMCNCNDSDAQRVLIGSSNSVDLQHNTLGCWLFDVRNTPTCIPIATLNIGSHVVMNSAVYDNNVALLTHMQGGASYITLALIPDSDYTIDTKSTTTLTSMAYKVQWFVAPDGTPYIITDEYEHISLYAVDMATYTLTLTASTANMAAGEPSSYLYWLLQGTDVYAVQGCNGIQVVTYKVHFDTRTVDTGVVSDVNMTFSTVHGCSTCYDYLVLAGTSTSGHGIVARYSIDPLGYLTQPSMVACPGNVHDIYYCERCCCGNNNLLIGTDAGLYSLDADSFSIIASNVSMPNNQWINVSWCCASGQSYCLAVDSTSGAHVFKQQASSLLDVLSVG